MITVTVSINGNVIIARSARRVETRDINTYTVDDGRSIKHRYDDGAAQLAIKMLEGVITP